MTNHQEELDQVLAEEDAARVKLDEILGIVFFTVAILLLAGWRFEQSGAIHTASMALLGSIGAGMWYLIFMFALWGVNKFRGRAVISDWIQFASWVALLPVFLGFLQGFDPNNRELGGTIGWTLYTHLEDLAGSVSARILLTGFCAILTVICLDTPLTQIFATGYRASGQATGLVRPLVVLPFTFLYSVVYTFLCYFHMIVFVVLKDLVIVFEILYERIMMVEEPAVASGPEFTSMSSQRQPRTADLPPRPVPPRPPDEPIINISGTGADQSDSDAAPPRSEVPSPQETRKPPSDQQGEALLAGGLQENIVDDVESQTGRDTASSVQQPVAPQPEEGDMGLVLRPQRADPVESLEVAAPSPQPPAQPEPDERATDDEGPVEPDPAPVESAESPTTSEEVSVADDVPVATMPDSEFAANPPPGLFGGVAGVVQEVTGAVTRAVTRKEYTKPSPDLFEDPPDDLPRDDEARLRANAEKLVDTLAQFRIKCSVSRITQGPTVTQFEVKPAPGVKISNIVNLSNDIAMALATPAIRIEAPIPGRSAVGIEVPNEHPIPVMFKEIITHESFSKLDSPLGFVIGREITGKPIVADLARMPHLLVAGATGSGKSVCINTLISSILYRSSPEEVKFILIDPKVVELALYDGIPNLITEVITDPQDATAALRWAVLEMERRYRYLSKFAARNIRGFNRRLEAGELTSLDGRTPPPDQPMPYIVIVIDELADLMMLARKEIEDAITRLAQMARAVGIHLVLATQRPSTNIITGVLKANLPSRIAFSVSSQVDSKVILDHVGADKLLGSGDMLYGPIGQAKPIRLQGAYISEEEVRRLVDHLKSCGEPDYSNIVEEVLEPDSDLAGEGMTDDKFADCVRIAIDNGEASTSMLQRHLKIGYNRAARIMEAMEARGIISGSESGKRRKVLISEAEAEKFFEPAL